MHGVTCVVFDVDDTLYLERDYVRSGLQAVGDWAAGALGLAGVAERCWSDFEAGRRGDLFDRALAALGRAPDRATVGAMVERYRSHRPQIGLLPDAAACLGRLRGRVALAAVTDGPVVSQRAKVEALGLSAWLEPIVLTGELGPGCGKPSPAAFRLVEATLGQAGPACLYVADNPLKDFAGPRGLGWRTIRVRRAEGLHAGEPSGGDVELELPSLEALGDLIGATR